MAAALPPGAVLVDLLDYVHYSPPEGGKGPFRRERRLVAFVLRRGQAPVLVPLGASRPIDEAVRAWRQALVAGTPEPMQAAALELSRRVWEPLKPHLEGATTVLVAPDGALTQFPLAALPGHRPGTYLVEDLAIGYVSSAHRLVETLAAPSEAKPKSPEAERRRPAGHRRHRLPGRPRRRGSDRVGTDPQRARWRSPSARASGPWPAPGRKCGASPSSSTRPSPSSRPWS